MKFERFETGLSFFPDLEDGFLSPITGKIYFLSFNVLTIYDSPGFEQVGEPITFD
jgi:hypothetical protein